MDTVRYAEKIDDSKIIEVIKKSQTDPNFDNIFGTINFSEADYREKREVIIRHFKSVGNNIGKNFVILIKSFEEFENILYGIDPLYRDHLAHSFRVWGLGIYLYHKLKELNYECIRDLQRNDFYFQWYLASVYHDIGIPIQNLKKLDQKVDNYLKTLDIKVYREKEYSSTTIGFYIGEIRRLLSSNPNFHEILDILDYPDYDFHGSVSAWLLFIQLYQRFKDNFKKPNSRIISTLTNKIKNSLKAIALHDSSEPINIRDDFIPSLLIICDELQDWGREYIPVYYEGILSITDFLQLDLNISDDILEINAGIEINKNAQKLEKECCWDLVKAIKSKAKNFERINGIKVFLMMSQRASLHRSTLKVD